MVYIYPRPRQDVISRSQTTRTLSGIQGLSVTEREAVAERLENGRACAAAARDESAPISAVPVGGVLQRTRGETGRRSHAADSSRLPLCPGGDDGGAGSGAPRDPASLAAGPRPEETDALEALSAHAAAIGGLIGGVLRTLSVHPVNLRIGRLDEGELEVPGARRRRAVARALGPRVVVRGW